MNLSDLLSKDIALKLCLKSSIDSKKLTKLIQKYPQDFIETILRLQNDKRKPQYLSLPDLDKKLKFKVRKSMLTIEFSKEKNNINNIKFKALLGQIYEEIMDEHHLRITGKGTYSIDEVDDLLSRF